MASWRARCLAWGIIAAAWLPLAAMADPQAADKYAAWAEGVSAKLSLDPGQRAAFDAYIAAMRDTSAQTPSPSVDQFRAMTAPQRLDYLASRIGIDLKIAQAQAQALHKLYDVLSADQRKVLDDATAPPGGKAALATVVQQPERDKPDYSLPSHTNPNWLVVPSQDDIARVYPSQAQKQKVGGNVVITCMVDPDGYLADCVVDSETPPGLGFGNAALEITAYMRMLPATNYGVPVPAKVNVPVSFLPPKQ